MMEETSEMTEGKRLEEREYSTVARKEYHTVGRMLYLGKMHIGDSPDWPNRQTANLELPIGSIGKAT
jgi:hypothetical protein